MERRVQRGRYGLAKALWVKVLSCFTAALLLTGGQVARANKKAAVPPSVLAARTIYIDNQTTDGGLRNNAYLGFAKWGHLQVVESADKADVVLVLTGGSYVKAVSDERPMATTGGKSAGAGPAAPNASGASAPALPNGYEAAPDGFTRLTLVDPKTGLAVWSDLSKTNNAQNAAHIVDGLREAFEQSSKSR